MESPPPMGAVQGDGARVVLHGLPSAAPQSATAQPTKAAALQKPMGPNGRNLHQTRDGYNVGATWGVRVRRGGGDFL